MRYFFGICGVIFFLTFKNIESFIFLVAGISIFSALSNMADEDNELEEQKKRNREAAEILKKLNLKDQ
jgi:hypothetical protein